MNLSSKLYGRWARLLLPVLLVTAAALFFAGRPFAATEPDFDQNRTRVLTYVLRQQVNHHFSGKPIDDTLSKGAFQLYLKQLDYQKRFLLDNEVRQLRAYEQQIDDEIMVGRIQLVPLAERLMSQAIARAERLVRQIMAQPFDFTISEDYETDPDKLGYCRTEAELKERWRKELKYRVLSRYLAMAG